jgi:hypothetical protein
LLSFICYTYSFSIIGKDKNFAEKVVLPSTTQGGKDLPSRPNFSCNFPSAIFIRKKNATLSGSPLSKMSANIESNLLGGSRDKEVTRDSSKSPSIDDVESELDDNEYSDNDDCEIESKEDLIFTRDFMSRSLEDLDKLDRYKDTPLDEFFPAASKSNEPAIYIKDKDYEFSVDPKIIIKDENFKFYGKNNEFPFEHIAALHDLSVLFGKDEIQQGYYFLKLFPFTLGADAKTW